MRDMLKEEMKDGMIIESGVKCDYCKFDCNDEECFTCDNYDHFRGLKVKVEK